MTGSNAVTETTEQSFRQDVLESDRPVLVDFWAPWCGPCRMVGPIVEKVAEQFAGTAKVVKVNVDDNPQLAMQYGVVSIPTLAFFSGGRLVDSIVGAAPQSMIADGLRRLMPPA